MVVVPEPDWVKLLEFITDEIVWFPEPVIEMFPALIAAPPKFSEPDPDRVRFPAPS
jgi:hypothetical protein